MERRGAWLGKGRKSSHLSQAQHGHREGVYLKDPTGSSSVSFWLQIRANSGGREEPHWGQVYRYMYRYASVRKLPKQGSWPSISLHELQLGF